MTTKMDQVREGENGEHTKQEWRVSLLNHQIDPLHIVFPSSLVSLLLHLPLLPISSGGESSGNVISKKKREQSK
jgi:hypothetical protein